MLLERLHLVQPGQITGSSEDTNLSSSHYSRIQLHNWVAALACADIFGAIVFSFVAFNLNAEPDQNAGIMLWGGFGVFIVAWGLASHSQGLYERATVLGGQRALLIRAIATCAIAFGLIMLLAFGVRLIGGISRFWLLASAAGACLWVVAARLLFRQRLEMMLRNGYCLDRALMLCGSTRTGNLARDSVERESRGQIRGIMAQTHQEAKSMA